MRFGDGKSMEGQSPWKRYRRHDRSIVYFYFVSASGLQKNGHVEHLAVATVSTFTRGSTKGGKIVHWSSTSQKLHSPGQRVKGSVSTLKYFSISQFRLPRFPPLVSLRKTMIR